MIQLAFQQAYDPYHAVFRFFFVRDQMKSEVSVDHYRIVDFYVCFPSRLGKVRLAQTHARFRKAIREFEARPFYGEQPSDALVFARMKPVQDAALHTLAIEGFMSEEALAAGRISETKKAVSEQLELRLKVARVREPALAEIAGVLLNDYSLNGPNGVKARTGLMESRYDAV